MPGYSCFPDAFAADGTRRGTYPAWRDGREPASRGAACTRCGPPFSAGGVIKRYLDILAFHKINTFHWHLPDGIGWRIEIDRYPLLTEKGAWRKVTDERAPWIGFETSREGAPDSYGGYYTKEEIRVS